jgi:hypothetical protein
MLAPNEKRLLYILVIVLAFCLVGGFIFLRLSGPGGLSEVNSKITTTEGLVRNILKEKIDPKELPKKIADLDKILNTEKNKVYKPNEIDISEFGIQVRKLLVKNRLSEQSLRTIINNNEKSLQFQFRGAAYDFASFLKDVSANDKYWKIEDLMIKAPKQYASVDVTMRITYETAAP